MLTTRYFGMDVMHDAKLVHKYLKCHLYTDVFSDKFLKMASNEMTLYVLAMTNLLRASWTGTNRCGHNRPHHLKT